MFRVGVGEAGKTGRSRPRLLPEHGLLILRSVVSGEFMMDDFAKVTISSNDTDMMIRWIWRFRYEL